MCVLVIHSKVEQSILVRTRQDGDDLSGAGGLPHNCSGIFTKDCLSMGHRMGGYSTSSLHRYNGPPRIKANVEDRIR
jgi:structural maintenance of chromosomes protein 6